MSFFGTISSRQGRGNLPGVAIARGARAQKRIEKLLTPGGKSLRALNAFASVLGALCAAPLVCFTAAAQPVLARTSSAFVTQEPPNPPAAPAAPAAILRDDPRQNLARLGHPTDACEPSRAFGQPDP